MDQESQHKTRYPESGQREGREYRLEVIVPGKDSLNRTLIDSTGTKTNNQYMGPHEAGKPL